MNLFHLFPLLIFCFAPFFIQLSYPYALHPSYPSYEKCSPSACYNSTIIKYPFQILLTDVSATCSDMAYVYCPDHQTSLLRSNPQYTNPQYSSWFRVLGGITELSYTARTIRVAPNGLFDCSALLSDFDSNSLVSSVYFKLSDKYRFVTILNCTKQTAFTSTLQRVECLDCGRTNNFCFILNGPVSDETCSSYGIVIPADKNYNISAEKNLTQFLQGGFDVTWEITSDCHACESSSGRCSGRYSPFDACICRDGAHASNCNDGNLIYKNKKKTNLNSIAVKCGLIFGIAAMATVIIIIYTRINRKRKETREEEQDIRAYMDPLDSRPPSVEHFLQGVIPTKYSYAQIKRYTNNFADTLGKGGFGTVFKAKLPNGCEVAIKVLDKSKQSQNQFMNEVATVGRIHHIHLVRLLGYSFQGSKRALVYEYMVNGSLEKYIHGDDQNALDWKQLYSIAMGAARGIAYLHDECRSRILHCDIKPHNVLLDANFSPKIADFGLAKLTDREESHISLTGARGTPGYVAPEVWSRSYGPVTDRSDVYSYGMLVMEMVGGRKNFNMGESRSSKFYYPEWAFKQVEKGEFGRLRKGNIRDEVDENIAKKLSMLGLWCIQHNPSHRPPMSRVIQMLEGNIDITVPPLPFPEDTLMHTPASAESFSSI